MHCDERIGSTARGLKNVTPVIAKRTSGRITHPSFMVTKLSAFELVEANDRTERRLGFIPEFSGKACEGFVYGLVGIGGQLCWLRRIEGTIDLRRCNRRFVCTAASRLGDRWIGPWYKLIQLLIVYCSAYGTRNWRS